MSSPEDTEISSPTLTLGARAAPEDSASQMSNRDKLPQSPDGSSEAPPASRQAAKNAATDERRYIEMLTAQNQSAAHSQLLGSRRPKPKKRWQHRSVKLLVVGDSGLGKTTLVRCLLTVPGEALNLHDGSATSFSEFQKDPSEFLSTIEWDDVEDHVHWTYQVQDTPGYGDDLNLEANVERVKKYVTSQNKAWMELENSTARGELALRVDPRVDVCIFCLPPHRVRNIDMLFMYEISRLVPIIPVVTKADTMTIKECVTYRTELHNRLKYPSLPGRKRPISLFQFNQSTLAACGITDNAIASAAAMRPPYLVVCSNLYNEERLAAPEPELWPERRYMWGTSEAMNPQHSDLLLLRRLLLVEGVEEISHSKTSRYEAWRQSQMSKKRPLRKMAKALLTTIVVLGVISGIAAATGKVDFKEAAEGAKKGLKTGKDKVAAAVDAITSTTEEQIEEAAEETHEAVQEAAAQVKEALPLSEEPKKEQHGFWFGRK